MDLRFLLNPAPDPQYPHLIIHQDVRLMQGRRHQLTVSMRPLYWPNPTFDPLIQLMLRFEQLLNLALRTHEPGQTLTIVLQYRDQVNMVREFGVTFNVNTPAQRFLNADQIRHQLVDCLVRTFENFAQSGDEVAIDEVMLVMRFDRFALQAAYGRMKSYVRRAVMETQVEGLATYESTDGLCGYQAIIYHLIKYPAARQLWSGDFQWYEREFLGNLEVRYMNKKKLGVLGRKLMELMGCTEAWSMDIDHQGNAQRFVLMQPKFQILIYNQHTRQVFDVKKGVQFSNQPGSTIAMSYTLGHLQLIKNLKTYLDYRGGNRYQFCCMKFAPDNHQCTVSTHVLCPKCKMRFESDNQQFHEHCKGTSIECEQCSLRFHNQECHDFHKCKYRYGKICKECHKSIRTPEHVCEEFQCVVCLKQVREGHKCFIQKLERPEIESAEDAGRDYYVFDFESLFTPTTRLVQGAEQAGNLHAVNLVVVKSCFGDGQWVFNALPQFHQWLLALERPSTLFAHNLKGYDGRLFFEYLITINEPPGKMTWNGGKIMSMDYGKIKFCDTLLHFPNSLEQLPKIFGMDESQFKKGFFPYRFNTPANQQYIGYIPSREDFDTENMSPRKLAEFNEWYPRQTQIYDFARELREYCISDCKVLAQAICIYMREQMAIEPLNPFSRLTSAGYAMAMFKTYYMPEDSFGVLTAGQEDDIREAMHGGRTDTRCLLKEWSPEEVHAGVYGKYQDVQSLYPTVQFYDPMPIGNTTKKTWYQTHQPTIAQVRAVFGFVCVDIRCTRYVHHPIIVHVENGKLIADLNPKQMILVPTPELHLALDNGYVIERVHYWYHFEQSCDVFKPYMRKFLKAKLQASKLPAFARTEEGWQEYYDYHRNQLGITLDRESIQDNPGKKVGAKLLLNSLWGKMGERDHGNSWDYFQNDNVSKAMSMEMKWINGDIDVNYYSTGPKATAMAYKYGKELPAAHIYKRQARGKRNVAVAAMVTSHARCRLWTEMNKLGRRVLYHDTDSIIYEYRRDEYNIPEGKYLGEWEDECGGKPIIAFTSTGPKCYAYKTVSPDGTVGGDIKLKGITLTSRNRGVIHYDSMKSLVTDDMDKIEANLLAFHYNRNQGQMVTSNVVKVFKKTYAKGNINPQTWEVTPFGSDLFGR